MYKMNNWNCCLSSDDYPFLKDSTINWRTFFQNILFLLDWACRLSMNRLWNNVIKFLKPNYSKIIIIAESIVSFFWRPLCLQHFVENRRTKFSSMNRFKSVSYKTIFLVYSQISEREFFFWFLSEINIICSNYLLLFCSESESQSWETTPKNCSSMGKKFSSYSIESNMMLNYHWNIHPLHKCLLFSLHNF